MPGTGTAAPPRLDDHKLGREHAELWKFIKYIFVGLSGALPEIVVQMLLIRYLRGLPESRLPDFFFFNIIKASIPPRPGITVACLVYAFLISTCLGQAIAFVFNRKATFRADSNVALSTFFALLVVIGIILFNGVVGPAVTGLVAKIPFLPEFWVSLLGKLLSMGLPMAWVYPANRFIVHRATGKKQNKEETI